MNKLNFFQNKPKATKIDVDSYLNRIELEKEQPSLSYLKKLQKAHLLHIPFENLDIHYGSRIILDYGKIYDKVINRGRGGFCYELNGLFYHLLYHLGFECYIISAEVYSKDNQSFGRPFDHMAVIVRMSDEEFLVDVGFGDGIINPFKLVKETVQMDHTKYWKMVTDPDERLILQVSNDTTLFSSQLRFTLAEKQLIEFMEMCDYHQSSPSSSFTQKKLVTKLLPNGRVTLTDRKLKIQDMGVTEESEIMHEDEFLSKLEQHFFISFQQLIPSES